MWWNSACIQSRYIHYVLEVPLKNLTSFLVQLLRLGSSFSSNSFKHHLCYIFICHLYHDKDTLDIIVSISAFFKDAVQCGACLIVYSLWQRSYAFESPEVSTGESYFMKLNYPFKVSTSLHYASWTLHLIKNELVPSNWVVPTPCLEIEEFLFWICSSVMGMWIFDPPCYLSTLMVLHEDSDACSLFFEE